MLVHELAEVLVGVLPAGVLVQQVGEVGEHLGHRRPVGVGGVLQRLLHSGEPRVERLGTQQVLDPPVRLAGVRRGPVVVLELPHRGRRTVGEVLDGHLPQRAVHGVHLGVAGELPAFGEQRLVEQLRDLVEGAAQPVALQQFLPAAVDAPCELVEPGVVAAAGAQELAHGLLGRVAGHDTLGHRVECLGQVERGRERVRPADVASVAGAGFWSRHRAPPAPTAAWPPGCVSRRRRRRPRSPWTGAARGTAPPAPARSRRPAGRRWWRRPGRRSRRTAPVRTARAVRPGTRSR